MLQNIAAGIMEDLDTFEEGEEVDYDFNLDDDLLDEGVLLLE